jgi:hypothetical protein
MRVREHVEHELSLPHRAALDALGSDFGSEIRSACPYPFWPSHDKLTRGSRGKAEPAPLASRANASNPGDLSTIATMPCVPRGLVAGFTAESFRR